MPFSLKEFFKKVFPDKKEFEEMPENIIISESPAPPSKSPAELPVEGNKEVLTILETMKAENKKILDELILYKQKEEDRSKLLDQKAQDDKKAKIEALIKEAIDTRKIEAQNKPLQDSYKALLEKDLDNGIKAIGALPVIGGEHGQKNGQETKSTLETGGNGILNHIKEHQKSTALGEIK